MNIIVPLFADFLTANKETSIMFKFDVKKPGHETQCGKQFDFYLTNTRSLTSFLETCKVAVARFKNAGFLADPCRMAVISKGNIATRSLNKAEYNKSLQDNKLREGAFLNNERKWEYVAIPQPTQERVGLFFPRRAKSGAIQIGKSAPVIRLACRDARLVRLLLLVHLHQRLGVP